METYDTLRHFAGSWGLIVGIAIFAGVVLWVFRPSARKAQDEAARQIFRNEDAPAPEPGKDRRKKDQGDGH